MAELRPLEEVKRRPVKTALHQAVLDGRPHQARLLVDKHGGKVDCRDIHGRTALMLACMLPNADDGFRMAKTFIKAGAYPNVRDHMGRTALHYACMKGRQQIVDMLLKDDVTDVAVTDNDGNTALLHAALSGNPTVLQTLVDTLLGFGMKMDERNALGYTALLLACKYRHYTSAYTLLTIGKAQPTLRDNEFYLNASEWLQHSPNRSSAMSLSRSRSLVAPRFNRENTMYGRWSDHVCCHGKTTCHPLAQSLDSTLRLPPVFSNDLHSTKPEECFIDGNSSRMLLQMAIDDVTKSGKTVRQGGRSGRLHPATAKLLALTPRAHTTMFPDMHTLFKLYSEQYDDSTNNGQVPNINVRMPSAPESDKQKV